MLMKTHLLIIITNEQKAIKYIVVSKQKIKFFIIVNFLKTQLSNIKYLLITDQQRAKI